MRQGETIGNDVDDEVLDPGEALNLVGAEMGEGEKGERRGWGGQRRKCYLSNR